jgi:hypothetical protein
MSKRTGLKGRWLAEYRCGCTSVEKLKRDLLDYCALHGDSLRHIHRLPTETETGHAR